MVRAVFLTDVAVRREMGALISGTPPNRIVADPESLDSFRWIRTGRRDILARRDSVTIDTAGAGRFKTVAAKILPNLGATGDRPDLARCHTRDADSDRAGLRRDPRAGPSGHGPRHYGGTRLAALAPRGDRPGPCSAASQSADRDDRSQPHAGATGRVPAGAMATALAKTRGNPRLCSGSDTRIATHRTRHGGRSKTSCPPQRRRRRKDSAESDFADCRLVYPQITRMTQLI